MPRQQRRRWPALVIGGLVVINVALIAALVLRQTMQEQPTSTAVPAASPSSAESTATPPSPRPTSTPTSTTTSSNGASGETTARPSDEDAVADPRRVMAASSSSVAWRAEVRDCGEASTVEVSTNGGRTWRATEPGLDAIVRLKSYGDQSVFALGADDDCKASFASVENPDARWQTDQSMTADIWYRVPDDDDVVHAPGGATSRPCGDELVGFAGRGTYEAAAICADGRLRTIREGRSWTTVRNDTGAVAVNADDNRFTVARAMDGCDGLVVQHFGASGRGLSDDPDECWDIGWQRSDPVAVASRGEVTWLWSGDEVKLS